MTERNVPSGLPIIAIGASAGGLDSCRALLSEMPGNLQAALILILHLDPTHDSMMVDLLANNTKLKVVQAKDGMRLRAGVVHVIPPGMFLTVAQHVIHLSEPDQGKVVRLPFDVLLRSLANGSDAPMACIVLSGTGTDGTLGIADFIAAKGVVIAQDPTEAGYSGMPKSAIGTGSVSHVLATKDIPAVLEALTKKGAAQTQPKGIKAPQPAVPDTDYSEVLSLVSAHATQDMSLYKRGTLERRIARRMALVGLGPENVEPYLRLLRSDPDERIRLSSDLLIHVTSFFRDAAAFEYLFKKAIPDLIKALSPDQPLRVWVAGCSTGEEAYSLAILCLEALKAAGSNARLQILASDVDPEAIAVARTGFYPQDISTAVSPERLARHFVSIDGGWRVTSTLRDVIVFTVADLLSDPPFSRIDLVSCRNVLIYLGPEAQKRVIARCCFALRKGGLLLLGAAEMPGQNDGCFAIENKDARLWRRVGQSHPNDLHFAIGRRDEAAPSPNLTPVKRGALADLCCRIVLELYAPAAVLVNARLDCLYLLGPTERYLTVTQGHPGAGLVGMLPKTLRARFKTAASSCNAGSPKVIVQGARNPGAAGFDIAIHAVSAGAEHLLLVCFIDVPHRAAADEDNAKGTGKAGRTADLEAALEAARSDLTNALRDLEQEVEAHSADAAEALSVNEEFQSTNEELLASKEELQSLNEELTALNGQLQETLERHRTTANDLQNVLFSTDVATLFLDLELRIRFFTPAARAIFHVIPTDVGRPLADLAAIAKDENLAPDARGVLATSDPIERETAGTDGMWFLRRIQPYRGEHGQVEGVVITYVDITERKETNAALVAATTISDRATRAKSRFLAAASHDLRQPLQSMVLLNRLLTPKKRTTEGARLARIMDQTLNSMTAMLDSMLDANRIDSGIVRPKMRPVAIAALMDRLVGEFGPQCELKHLKLRSVSCKAWVQTDPQLLEQILRNLLSNALKYTPKGGILMGCRRRGTELTILVCDTGIGVPRAETKAIFDAYHKVEKSPLLSEHGLGLGLSIVQRLAALLDHPISVSSNPGKGSSFMITLPVVEPIPDALPTAATSPSLPVTKRQTGTILLVEDEDSLRDLLAEVLTKEGHTVITRSNAQEALVWASGDVAPPDLLLTDFDLYGGANGLTLAQDLPDVLGTSVPTIILTGDITVETLRAIARTSHHQVVKPVLPEVLLALIADLMLKSSATKVGANRKSSAAGTTIHIIDDDLMLGENMRRLFEAEGWKAVTHSSAEAFLKHPPPKGIACLVVDHVLPGMDGVALIKLLRSRQSRVPSVMLTAHGDAAVAVAALKAGATDLIEKPASAAELLAAVRQALSADDTTLTKSGSRYDAKKRFSDLTAREREVLAHILSGQPNKIIAYELGINQRTVENHRASVMRKSGAASLPALVRLALAADVQGM